MTEIIKTESISKYFGCTPATDHISIQVNQGDIYGFIGLNGAGKTTLIRMLLGMVRPDKGQSFLFGKEVTQSFDLWNEVGYLVETPHAYPSLTVRENLQIYYKLRQLENPTRLDEIIHKLKLTRYENVRSKHLSLGNKQRLGLAKALMHRPKLLILDEPINGLDPAGIIEVRELLKEIAKKGSTIFLSSHILGEVAKIANRIGIIHHGKMIKEVTREELFDQIEKKVCVKTRNNEEAVKHLTDHNYDARIKGDEIEVYDEKAMNTPEGISRLLVEKGNAPTELRLFTEDLENYFLKVIKNA